MIKKDFKYKRDKNTLIKELKYIYPTKEDNNPVRQAAIQEAVRREKRRLEGLTELIKRHDKVRGLSLRDRQYIISAEQYCNDHKTSYTPFFIPKVIANKLKKIVIRQLCKQYRNIWKGSVFIYFLRIGIYPILSIEFKVYQSMGLFSSWSVRAEYEVNIDSDQIKLVSASPYSF